MEEASTWSRLGYDDIYHYHRRERNRSCMIEYPFVVYTYIHGTWYIHDMSPTARRGVVQN